MAGIGQNSASGQSTDSPLYTSMDNHSVLDVQGIISLSDALSEIENDYDVSFLYNSKLLEGKLVESSILKSDSLAYMLSELLIRKGLSYRKETDRTYVIMPKPEPEEQEAVLETVSGTVTDSQSGDILPGVNVVVSGTTTGTSTDGEGSYVLNVPSLQDTLIFSFVGFESQTVPIEGRTQVDVELTPETFQGSELIVVGYQTQQKATSTGSISTVQGDQIEKAPVINAENSLVGRLPGLVAMNNTGQPGESGSTLRIRGSNTLGDNSPLVVIDGVTNRTGGLSRLNPNDIESITVLKDASAAIYGSQAANGVILVTTKKGREGKPRVSISYNQGYTQPTRVPEMADAATYAQMINEIDMYRGREPRYTDEDIQKYRSGTNPWTHPNTDWFDAAFKDLSKQSKINASVSGGSETITYYLSLGTASENGYFQNSGFQYDQYNFRSNIEGQINDNLNISLNLSGRRELQEAPIRGVGPTFRALMRGKPTLPAYWPNGQPGPDIEYGDNPVVTGTQATGYNRDKRDVLQSNIKVEFDVPFVEGLELESNVSYDKDYQFNKLWETPWYLYTWDYQTYDSESDPVLTRAKRGLNSPQLTQDASDNYQATLNLIGRYQKDFGDHTINLLAGVERQTFRDNFFSAYREQYLSGSIDQLFAGSEDQKDNNGSAFEGARQNYFGRVNYNYKEKYLVEFVGRYDGSYIFPEGQRYGFFPGISVGWRLSEEPFWQENVPFLEGFKIRASWGQTGNDRIEPFQYLTTYGFGEGYIFNQDELVKSVQQERIPNSSVTWEVANQFDFGIDAEMLDGRLVIEADYFNYLRTDILWWRNASIPTTAGFSLPRENIGEVVNTGVDGRITFSDQIGDVSFDISGNAGYAYNKIKYWDEAPGVPEYQQSTGNPMNTELYYQADGVYNDQAEIDNNPSWPGARPGDIKFVDVNGDGSINGLDRVRINKNNMPRLTAGLSLDAAYKNFDFSALLQGATGAVRYVFTESGEIGNFLQTYADDRWTPDNPDSEHPRTYNRTDEYWTSNQNTYFLRSADYLRLKSVEIGYNLPASLGDRIGLQNMRVYVSGYNLFTIDKLKVFDPEASSSSGQYYPQKRVFNAGISLTF
ncbi:TonB-dependent receptor [Aliifodinibius sp. S!AR15-10]|uniref:SusC/RagA family TonB-linked outer membrane protein n=1 Tax=Aliifodinibius sp. S!AR15-10 TaxID=2950437 RepID=UPI0028703D95|nr:TonB-dependent receptor [Aliifodinibius sp. S!AR15-10]